MIADKCQVVVSDGLTMGHPCCGEFRCTIPLANNRDRFCPMHFNSHDICAITGCEQPVIIGKKSCAIPEHQQMEQLQLEKGKAAFMLKERLHRHRVSHPNNTMVTPTKEGEENTTADDLEDGEVWFENDNGVVQMFSNATPGSVGVVDEPSVPCEAVKSDFGNRKIKAQFGCRRTHNEQTLVRPCGVICARATFYGAEAVSNVLVMFPSSSASNVVIH